MQYIIFFVCLVMPVLIARSAVGRKRVWLAARKSLKQSKSQIKGEKEIMLKLVENLVGKMCEIRTVDNDYQGTIEGVEEGWIVLKDKWFETKVVVNPEYVVGIREYRVKRKAKKQAPVLAAEVAVADASDVTEE